MDIEEIINTRFDFLMSAALLVTLPVLTSITPFVRYHYASPVKSLQTIGIGGKSLFSRKFFLCLQYFVTMVMIVVSMFFVKQLNFMLGQDLGYRTENIIKVPFLKPNYNIAYLLSQEEQKAIQDKNKQITDELQQKLDASPLLENWVQGVSPNNANREVGFSAPGGERLPTTLVGANAKWLKLFDIKIKEGHSWDDENPFVYVMLAGESILKQYGITDYNDAELTPESRLWYALGRGIAQDEMAKNPPYHIIGIVKDFYTSHLSKKQNPVTIYYAKGHFEQPIIAAFLPENKKAVIAFMKSLHDELVGGDFTFTFIEDEIAETYKDDRKVAVIYSIFTGIAILVSILGLFGLSLFDIQERRKEIAIRKVNGASTFDIIRLLLKKYFTLLGIAFVVSVPVALFAIHKYLENFAMKAPVSWWLFAIALIVTVAVSMLTLIYQTHKASNENPAEVVKS
jgi:ABC-type antimicrobial peptide transport system permease subunit